METFIPLGTYTVIFNFPFGTYIMKELLFRDMDTKKTTVQLSDII